MSERLPIIVAVVGHRDIRADDVPMLEQRVEEVLREVQEMAPSSPLVLLSALAEGADRLAARVGLRMGIPLAVPLPKNRAMYEAEFASDASREEFSSLLGRAQHWFELPPSRTMNPDDDHRYERLVAFLIRHSQVLVALWDGVESNLAGGTANAVRFKLEGVPSRLDRHRSRLDPPDTGPVYHIHTPRESNHTPNGVPGSCALLTPRRLHGAEDTFAFDRIARHIDTFNGETVHSLKSILSDKRYHASPMVPSSAMALLHPSLQAEARAFAETDALAQFFQRKTNMVIGLFIMFTFFALFFFEVYAYYYPESPQIMLLYVVPIAAAYMLYLVARRRDYQNKYLDYRALAEGLRVQFFWHLAGLWDSVADHYMRKQRTELDWIRHAIRVWQMRVPASVRSTSDDAAERLGLLLLCWVDDQATYYANAAHRDDARTQRLSRFSNRLFMLGMLIAGLHVGLQWFTFTKPIYPMLMIMSMVLIAAGLIVIYSDKRGFSGQSKQFARMAELYGAAAPRLRKALTTEHSDIARELIFDLGRETLAENGDWVMMHRERPLEVPKFG